MNDTHFGFTSIPSTERLEDVERLVNELKQKLGSRSVETSFAYIQTLR